jgi:gamma-glutamylcyclotransferase (GGCT)/AIG2-like uncharacterized protein YtfP
VRGALYQVAHYPGLKRSRRGWVEGELYRLKDPPKVLAALDEWEGTDYRRVLMRAHLESGGSRLGWGYLYLPRVAVGRRILSGRFERIEM